MTHYESARVFCYYKFMKKILLPQLSKKHHEQLARIAETEQRPIGRQAKIIIEKYLDSKCQQHTHKENQLNS